MCHREPLGTRLLIPRPFASHARRPPLLHYGGLRALANGKRYLRRSRQVDAVLDRLPHWFAIA